MGNERRRRREGEVPRRHRDQSPWQNWHFCRWLNTFSKKYRRVSKPAELGGSWKNATNSNLLNVLEAWNQSQAMHSQALLNFSRVPFAKKNISKIFLLQLFDLTDFTDRMKTGCFVDETFHFLNMGAETSRKPSHGVPYSRSSRSHWHTSASKGCCASSRLLPAEKFQQAAHSREIVVEKPKRERKKYLPD